ncbi:hypothetical protein Kpho02_72790 [Kitasatospora phosalacinea]|uniref:Uncharacterized protein n=1 Tax=Kitasatospora phosalacinea TaxID=2065 RepID=A0A9W6QID1_9ACTN|nr:hypothetical protein Kpho02_72790 [Kitasatospora phosalacinea]
MRAAVERHLDEPEHPRGARQVRTANGAVPGMLGTLVPGRWGSVSAARIRPAAVPGRAVAGGAVGAVVWQKARVRSTGARGW